MTGLALEGGAKCTAFTAGVLDVFMEHGIRFPVASGVSAGGGCLANYRSEQPGRSLGLMLPQRNERYFGIESLLTSKKMIDLERLLNGVGDGQSFDKETYFKSEMKTDYVAACCETGLPEYLTDGGDAELLELSIKATCSVPVLCEPVQIGGKHYLDGSIADAVPFRHLLDSGCDRVIAVLTRQKGAKRTDYSRMKPLLMKMYGRRFPKIYECLMSRAEAAVRSVQELSKLERQGRVLVIRPTESAPHKFTNDSGKICAFYAHGRAAAESVIDKVGEWTK